MTKCELCNQRFTQSNPRRKHHVRGRRVSPEIMHVHEFACHPFADAVTQQCKLWDVVCTVAMTKFAYDRWINSFP